MDLGLAGKTAIVTGGGSNIGQAIVLALAREGANVVIADKRLDDGERVASKANSLGGGRVKAVATDVTKLDQVEAMVQKTLAEFKKLDVLVNNVGWDKIQPFLDTTPELWDQIIAINYKSMLNCFKVVLPHMVGQKNGAIVSISSVAGRVGEAREAVYAGCKSAIIGFSKSVAKEVGRFGVRINVVCPAVTPPASPEEVGQESGWKQVLFTPEQIEKMAKAYPLGKLGKPSDIAEAVIFLASSIAAGHMTGQTLVVDGGFTMV